MVVCTFRPGTDMAEVMQVVAEEQAKVAELKSEGHVGAIFLSTQTRRTVFLEILADDEKQAQDIVTSLPMSQWWDLDFYPINAPVQRVQ